MDNSIASQNMTIKQQIDLAIETLDKPEESRWARPLLLNILSDLAQTYTLKVILADKGWLRVEVNGAAKCLQFCFNRGRIGCLGTDREGGLLQRTQTFQPGWYAGPAEPCMKSFMSVTADLAEALAR